MVFQWQRYSWPIQVFSHHVHNFISFLYSFLLLTLPKSNAQTNQNLETAVVTGWGTLSSGASSLPSKLQKVSVPLVSDATCKKVYQTINPVVDSMVCYGVKGKDSCQGKSQFINLTIFTESGPLKSRLMTMTYAGDSGGPLIGYANNVAYEYGIVSWGVGKYYYCAV